MKNLFKTAYLLSCCYLVSSCVTLQPKSPFHSTSKGYVADIDEPTTRGRLYRVTPEEMLVQWRFCVSPDGEYIVFSGKQFDSKDYFQLYKIKLSGGAPIKLTSETQNVLEPSFTPDGKYIVYRTGYTFWKIKEDGSGAKTKLPGSGFNTDFFQSVSNKSEILFCTFDTISQKSMIWKSGLEGQNLTQIREGLYPSWSFDGSKIVFNHKNDLWIINSDGTNLIQLTNTPKISEFLPYFSITGDTIAFISDEAQDGKISADFNIWLIKSDGTGKSQVTTLKSWDSWPYFSHGYLYFLSGRGSGKKQIQSIWRIKLQ